MQTRLTEQLITSSILIIPRESGCGIEEVQHLQNYLQDCKIIVYKYGTKRRDVIFEGSEKTQKIHLLFHDGHFNVIKSLTSAFACSYYCEKYHVPYNTNRAHCEGFF